MADGRIVLVTGSSGSGKTAWTRQFIAKETRLLCWDPEAEFASIPGTIQVTDLELVQVARTGMAGRFAYVPPKGSGSFDFWARCAWAYAQTKGQKCVVADETADVTNSGKASGAWGQIIRRGRKYECTVVGITQRPAESDKTIVGNASLIHICPQWETRDRKYLAERFDVPLDQLTALQANRDQKRFDYLEIDRLAGTKKTGFLQF